MTAFGFKQHGADTINKENPWGALLSSGPLTSVMTVSCVGRSGEPRDMAGVALFLASPASAYVTGTHIVVDGGSVITTRAKAKL